MYQTILQYCNIAIYQIQIAKSLLFSKQRQINNIVDIITAHKTSFILQFMLNGDDYVTNEIYKSLIAWKTHMNLNRIDKPFIYRKYDNNVRHTS